MPNIVKLIAVIPFYLGLVILTDVTFNPLCLLIAIAWDIILNVSILHIVERALLDDEEFRKQNQ